MAKIRIGFSTHFEIENELAGIGTDNPTNTKQVLGNIHATNTKAVGVSTLTTFDGFVDTKASISGLEGSEQGSLSGEIIIEGDITVSSGATFRSGPESLTVTDSFTLPGISDDKPSAGTMRFNENLGALEFYTGSEWRAVNSYVDMGNRGICMMMGGDNPSRVDFAHYVNIMTQGNSINFGDLHIAISQSGGGGNAIRAMCFGGSLDSGNSDTIQYTTLGSQGKFNDFGNLSSGRQTVAVVSTSVQATATAGATSGDTVQNILE